MTSYDDAEGMLQDQGLEVVVIPYRPSPPPPAFRPPRHPPNNNNEQLTPQHSRTPTPTTTATVSPASGDEQLNGDDGGSMSLVSSPPPPPPPPSSTHVMFTPRTRSLVAEAINQKSVETTPPPPQSRKMSTGRGRGRGRSSSCTRPSPIDATCNNINNTNRKSNTCTSTNNNSLMATRPNRSRSSPVTSSYQRKSCTSANSDNNNINNNSKRNNNQMGLYQMAKAGYQELCNAIIRPPRSKYTMESLGPEEFNFCGTTIIRKDFGVVNDRGLLLECSMWKKKDLAEEAWHVEGDDDDREGVEEMMDEDENSCDIDASNENIHNNLKCGHITLNVEHWDESKERGQMYLHVPESFDIASSSSTLSLAYGNNDDIGEEEEEDYGHVVLRKSTSHSSSSSSSRIEEDELHCDIHRQQQQRRHHSETIENDTACNHDRGGINRQTQPGRHRRRRNPVVIYLHGNSSGRTEVISQLGHLLSLGVSIVAFDFSGSGMSEGEFVSLGYYEQEDLKTVIHHLKASGEVSTIALWGRSMGAATAIMYGSHDPTISCMILDSPFTDLVRLCEEMVQKVKDQGLNVPNFVVSVALRMIKRSVKYQAGFSIRHISPISHVHRCFIPAMFVAGEHDDFIDKQHSRCLHAKYAGDKNLVFVDGDHNSPRPRFLLQSACLFLQSCMQLPPSSELVVPHGTNLVAPPWASNNSVTMLGRTNENIARAEASLTLEESRSWLPVNGAVAKQNQQPIPRQRSHPHLSSKSSTSSSLPPGLPMDNHGIRSRSCADDSYVTASPPATPATLMEATPLPEMSERQKNIQRSLFKMLGKHD